MRKKGIYVFRLREGYHQEVHQLVYLREDLQDQGDLHDWMPLQDLELPGQQLLHELELQCLHDRQDLNVLQELDLHHGQGDHVDLHLDHLELLELSGHLHLLHGEDQVEEVEEVQDQPEHEDLRDPDHLELLELSGHLHLLHEEDQVEEVEEVQENVLYKEEHSIEQHSSKFFSFHVSPSPNWSDI